jgi:hypothetical protein
MSDIQKFTCNICTRKFSRKYNLKIHIRSKHDHSDLNFSCYLCRKNFKNQATYLDHIDQHKEGLSFVLYKKAFDKTIIIYRKKLKDYFALNQIMNELEDIQSLFQAQLLQYPKFKINILIQVEYILKGNDNKTIEKEIFNIRSSNFIISKIISKKIMKKVISKHLIEIIEKEKEMNLSRSGWISNKLILIDITFHKINLLI